MRGLRKKSWQITSRIDSQGPSKRVTFRWGSLVVVQVTEKKRFSWLTGMVGAVPGGPWDVELCGTERFAAVPSLGSLVPGWTLIVPRHPMLSLRELSESARQELLELHERVAGTVATFGTPFAFEHGSALAGSVMGCGVDQAHLHVVPLEFDLLQLALGSSDEEISWARTSESPLTKLPEEGEYICIWKVGRTDGAVGSVRNPVSQWMRRVIAQQLGMDAQWNYRTSPHLKNIQKTIRQFSMT